MPTAVDRPATVGCIAAIVIAAGLGLAGGQSAGGGARGAPAIGRPIIVEKNVEARMRDGVVLRADVYRPETPERLPALLLRTPYSKSAAREDSQFRRLAAHGYVVVVAGHARALHVRRCRPPAR